MRTVSKFLISLLSILLLLGCTEEGQNVNSNVMEDTEDVETLAETNKYLIQQLEKEQEEVEKLEERIKKLESENVDLKDDILTYKQQIYELEDLNDEERAIRNDLDEKTKDFFDAMNEKNHERLEELVARNVTVLADREVLKISDENTTYSFDYLTMSNVNYVRQSDYEYKREDEIFTSEYIIYSGGVKEPFKEEKVYLTFTKDTDWKLSQIMYNL